MHVPSDNDSRTCALRADNPPGPAPVYSRRRAEFRHCSPPQDGRYPTRTNVRTASRYPSPSHSIASSSATITSCTVLRGQDQVTYHSIGTPRYCPSLAFHFPTIRKATFFTQEKRQTVMTTLRTIIARLVLMTIVLSTTAFAQDTTDADDLRSVIANLRTGSPEYDDMEPPLRIAVREQSTTITQFLAAMGPIRSIEFEETDSGVDIYLVRFRNGRTVWQFARSPRGRIGILFFNAF